MSDARETQLRRLGFAFVAACVSAVFFYGALRVVQSKLFPEPNPATVIWSAHAGFYWRCWTVSYAGVLVGFLAYGASRKHPEKVARALVHGLSVAVAAIVLQGVLVP